MRDTASLASTLRIVHYLPGIRLELGGVVRAVLDWCTVLAGRGHDVTLITYDSPDLPADWNPPGAGKPKVVWVPQASRPNGLVPRAALPVIDQELSPGTVLHLHCPWIASNMQVARLARRRGVPYVVSIHGMLDDWSMSQRGLKKRLFLAAGGRKYMERSARIHYTAAAERDQASKWIPRGVPAVLPYLVDLKPFDPLPGREPALAAFPAARAEEPKILFLSRIHEKKGVDILIEASARLRDLNIPHRVLIAGSGDPAYEQSLRKLAVDRNLDGIVTFLGLVRGVEKISLYQAADIFCLPTHQENFGLVLVEAMAAGAPVVTTRGTDIWQELSAAGASVVEPNPDAIARAIMMLLADRKALPDLGTRGRNWVRRDLNTNHLASQYEALYANMERPIEDRR